MLFWIGESVVVVLDGRGKQQSAVLSRALGTFWANEAVNSISFVFEVTLWK